MRDLFDQILVSSPNGGGLFLISNNKILQLDSLDTTSISNTRDIFLRGQQPSSLWICRKQVLETINEVGEFDDIHDALYHGKSIYLVGTNKNEIVQLAQDGEEIKRWLFEGEDDSRHINCLGIWNERIVFSAFGEFHETRGYKGNTKKSGYVQDLMSGKRFIDGLSQPHSLVPYGKNILVANSEEMEIREYALSGDLIRVRNLDGYTRGIFISDKAIYVGLSCSRNIEDYGLETAALVALDHESWEEIGRLSLPVNEIYSVVFVDNTNELLDTVARVVSYSYAKCDRKKTTFNEAVSERDSQIVDLNESMTERDKMIVDLNESMTERDEKIAGLNEALGDRDSQIVDLNESMTEQVSELNKTVAEREEQLHELTEETVRRGEWALGLDGELKEIKTKLQEVTKSNSWRLTLPLRETRRWVNNPFQQAKRYTKGGLRTLKLGYQSLPFSYKTKASHRRIITKLFPRMLLLSGSSATSIPSMVNPPSIVDKFDPLVDVHVTNGFIELETSLSPIVSVIIPVYGQVDYTIKCLESIQNNLPKMAFEVIVIDDCSPDNSVDTLQNIKGINLLKNAENQGFIRSCNAGAEVAKGEYLCFLNNDTKVQENWLDELLRTFDEFPGTGLAGSKLVYPDGRLQEAGGIIWQDGSAWNFGRFQDPLLPIYNYAREVDYCSGASIMVPKVLFEELGGFDEHYLPAYCEDSDLALKIRSKGYRVIYQPLSTVVHYEGVTSGTDTTQGTKAYQVINTKKMFSRWSELLRTHQIPGEDVDNAKDRMATSRVLVLDHCTPTPNEDSGSIDAVNHMLLLREMNFQVTFIPEDNFLFMPEHTALLQRAGIEVLYAPYCISVESHVKEHGSRYDLVFVNRPVVMDRNIKYIREHCKKAKVLFHTVDLHFLRMQREADLENDESKKQLANEMKKMELNLISLSDMTTVLSSEELKILSSEKACEAIELLPYSRSISASDKNFSSRRNIVFVGSYQHAPNVDAVIYFVTEIMPFLRKQLAGVSFYVVGANPPPEIIALESEDVIIKGFVRDLNSFQDNVRVSVAPLRYGAGIKGKVGGAMAVGLPVVATSVASEGMSLTNGENILVADEPEAFATAITKLYKDETLWNNLSQAGLEFADQVWGAEAAWNTLRCVLSKLGFNLQRKSHALKLFSLIEQGEGCSASKLFYRKLSPIFVAHNRNEYKKGMQHQEFITIKNVEQSLIESNGNRSYTVNGFCVPCNKTTPLLVDMESGGECVDGKWIPNWRERLVCPLCQMNNRQRLIATLLNQHLKKNSQEKVYFMEQVTPIYQWAINNFSQHQIIGSEYLGYEYKSGQVIKGIRHEDIENLSFSDAELGFIVSNDVFEHVPHPAKAFAECARVLKPGGVMLATIPFHSGMDESVIRAQLDNGQVECLLPEAYHGNPVSADGSLVFTDFGWDILEQMKGAGFSGVSVDVYVSAELGHFGGGQLVFRCKR